jgi:transposase
MKGLTPEAATIGCDLGDRKSELCVLWPDGRVERPRPVETTLEAMRMFFATRKSAHVVVEVGTHSAWVSELVKGLGHQVTVANPRKVQLIAKGHAKTDKKDAELLARLGRADRELLSPVQHRGVRTRADLAVLKARDALVASRTKLVNLCRGMAKPMGFRFPKCTAESFWKLRGQTPETLEPALNPVFDALEQLQKSIAAHERRAVELARTTYQEEMRRITQPKGVGILTALAFLLTLEDPKRFAHSRDVGPFLGLTPRKDQSGEVDRQLGITKNGDPFLRRLLVNSANYQLGPLGEDSDIRRWGQELAKRGGKRARHRAKVAVARKTAVLLHAIWLSGEAYEPLRQTQREEKNAA